MLLVMARCVAGTGVTIAEELVTDWKGGGRVLQSGVRILPQHLMGAAARLDQIQAIALRQRALRVHV